MAETSRGIGLSGLGLFLLVVGGAFALRACYVDACGAGAGPFAVQAADPHLAELVRNLETGDGFGLKDSAGIFQPTARFAPLYPWLLATIGSLELEGDPTRQTRWAQAGLGALSAGFLFLFALVAFQNKLTGLLAGILAAVYPFWIVNTAALEDGVVVTFLMSATLCFGALASQKHSTGAALFFGLALGGLPLARAAMLPFCLVALLWFLRRAAQVENGGRVAFVAFFGFMAPLVPWTVRNYLAFNDVYPVVDSTYRHVWIGHNADATGGPIEASPPETVPEQAEAAFEEVKGNFGATFARRMTAGVAFLFGHDWFTTGQLWRTPSDSTKAGSMSFLPVAFYVTLLLALFLALLGWRWSYLYHNEAQLLAVAALMIPLPYILGHAGALAGPRLPFDAVLIVYSAYALTVILNPLHERNLGG